MAQINPYIQFNGNAEEAFLFYQSVFGGQFTIAARFKDFEDSKIPISKNEENKIMHVSLPIGDHDFLLGSDISEAMDTIDENESRNKISISANSKEEADRIFNRLSEGGKINIPIADSEWGTYFGMLRDRFGIIWMVEYDEATAKE